ncbi:MAG: NfeD family protein [Acidimicrobiales bacterium]
MSGLYIFFLAVGAPLLVWMAFTGDGDGGDGFALDLDGDGPLVPIPLSAVAFFMATFGFVGVVGGATGAGALVLFITAALTALVAGLVSVRAFRWLREHSTHSGVTNAELEGTVARVTLPISVEHRGKIVVEIAGAREQMTAAPADGHAIDSGERVVIVGVENGVALVAAIDAGLELE